MILDGYVPPLAVAGFAQTLAERDLTWLTQFERKPENRLAHRIGRIGGDLDKVAVGVVTVD
jgi:hypothetical protein